MDATFYKPIPNEWSEADYVATKAIEDMAARMRAGLPCECSDSLREKARQVVASLEKANARTETASLEDAAAFICMEY